MNNFQTLDDLKQNDKNYNNFINNQQKIYLKKFNLLFDNFINILLQKEINFFGFTLNFPEFIDIPEEIWNKINNLIETFIEVCYNIDLIEFVYFTIEKHGERQIKREKKNHLNHLILYTKNKTMAGLPHFHGIIAIKSIVGTNFNLQILNNLQSYFLTHYSDILIKTLNVPGNQQKSFYNIKGYWNYITKELQFDKHYFIRFSDIYQILYGAFSDINDFYFFNKIKWINFIVKINNKYSLFTGISTLYNKKNPTMIILYLLHLFCVINNFFFNNLNIYKKIDKCSYSWQILYKLKDINSIIFLIYNQLKNYFPINLSNIDISQFIVNDFLTSMPILKENINILPIINFNKNIIEFKDGLYFLESTYFFRFEYNKKLNNLNIATTKYFNKYYRLIKNKKPNYWLNLLKQHFETEQDLISFCTNLGYYFYVKPKIDLNNMNFDNFNNMDFIYNKNDPKNKNICIVGSSNSGKSLLIANILEEALGTDNVGLISNINHGFAFELVENKEIIICDEFIYHEKNRSNLINFLDNAKIILNKKFKSQEYFKNEAPVIFIFNNDKNKLFLEDQAFKSRLIIYTFTRILTLEKSFQEIKDILLDELPQIIIYCTELFYNKYYSTNIIKNKRKLIKFKLKEKNQYILKSDVFDNPNFF